MDIFQISDIRNELHVRFYAEELWTGTRISQDEIEKELDGGRDPRTMKLTSNPLRVRQMMCKLVKAKEREIYLMRNTAVRPKSSQVCSHHHHHHHLSTMSILSLTISHNSFCKTFVLGLRLYFSY